MDDDEVLDLTPAFVEKKLRGTDGKIYVHRIYEAPEAVSIRYRMAMQKGVTFDSAGKPQSMPDGMAESESEFLAGCIKRIDDSGKEHKVLLQEVRAWPRRVVSKLYDIADNLSKIPENNAKNSPSAGVDTSD